MSSSPFGCVLACCGGRRTVRELLRRPSAAHRTHHLHLVADPEELARHIDFRDALRADPQLAQSYAALERGAAAQLSGDREGYTAAKTPFIQKVIADFRALRDPT